MSLPCYHFRRPSGISCGSFRLVMGLFRLVVGRGYVDSHVVGGGATAGGERAASNRPSNERVPRRRDRK